MGFVLGRPRFRGTEAKQKNEYIRQYYDKQTWSYG